MSPKVIKTEKDSDRVLARINDLMDADPGTSGWVRDVRAERALMASVV
jgi:hypothetical protein